MTAKGAPQRAVVESKRGPRCQRIELPGGGTAMVCSPAPYLEKLSCGHEGVWWAKAAKRRCEQCLEVPA